jgi:hypothetical protein
MKFKVMIALSLLISPCAFGAQSDSCKQKVKSLEKAFGLTHAQTKSAYEMLLDEQDIPPQIVKQSLVLALNLSFLKEQSSNFEKIINMIDPRTQSAQACVQEKQKIDIEFQHLQAKARIVEFGLKELLDK